MITKKVLKVCLFAGVFMLTMFNTTIAQMRAGDPLCEEWPWACPDGTGHLPGFPGSGGPGSLPEFVVNGSKINPFWPYGYPGVPIRPGFSFITNDAQRNANKPCAGDPFLNPTIAPTGPGKINGGRFGYTRTDKAGNQKFHDGLDLNAVPSKPMFSMYDGEVTMVKNSFAPGEYAKNSYGNYVEIKSTINGATVYLKYNHLNSVAAEITVGSQVKGGQQIGEAGNTGNAAYVLFPHLHIQAKDEDRNKLDPETFLRTKFDKNSGQVTNPCRIILK